MLNHILEFDIGKQFLDASTGLSRETISSLIIVGILCLLSFYIAIRARFADPLKKPKGILFIYEWLINLFDGLAKQLMGKSYEGFGGFFLAIASYLFISFIWGLTGLPAPTTYLATPLSLGLITFVLIHANAVKHNKLKYFKRYVEPLPFFLPINLISMWAPLLSLTMRLFGNALASWTLMTLLYSGLEGLSGSIFSGLTATFPDGSMVNQVFIAPFVTPVLHAYFDLFSGLIQTVVFVFLSMIFIGNEGPEDDEIDEFSREGGK